MSRRYFQQESELAAHIFVDPDALIYWNFLTVKNGGTPIEGSIYEISTIALGAGIDAWFITEKLNGHYSKWVARHLTIGATADTHAINAVDPGGAHEKSFSGSPLHDRFGVHYGPASHGDIGVESRLPDLTKTNLCIMTYCRTENQIANGAFDMGVSIGNSNHMRIRDSSGVGRMRSRIGNSASDTTGNNPSSLGLHISARFDAAYGTRTWARGVEVDTDGTPGGTTYGNGPIFEAARNRTTGPQGFSSRNYAESGAGQAPQDDAEALEITNNSQTLHTVLGRNV